MQLEDALKTLSQAFKKFHDCKIDTKTTHDSTCVGVELILYPDSNEELSGKIVLIGHQNKQPGDDKVISLFKNVGLKVYKGKPEETNDFNLEFEFDNIEELVKILNCNC